MYAVYCVCVACLWCILVYFTPIPVGTQSNSGKGGVLILFEVMTMILKMSDCDAKFMQMAKLSMLKCKDQCSSKTTVTFNHNQLQGQVADFNLSVGCFLIFLIMCYKFIHLSYVF